MSFSYSSLSMTFVHMFVSEIGRCCIGFFTSLRSLGMRKILALHISYGTICCSHMSCTSLTVISSPAIPPCFSSSAVIPSGPGAFLIGRWSTMYFICCLSGSSLEILSLSPISSLSLYRLLQYSLNCYFSVLFKVG